MTNNEIEPNCYNCIYRHSVPGDAHSQCANPSANVSAHQHGVNNGWFMWPFNFDPAWLINCDGFKEIE